VDSIYLLKNKKDKFGNLQEVSGQSEDVSLKLKPARMTLLQWSPLNHVIRSNWELGTQRNERNEMAMVGHTLRKDIGNTRYASMFK